jgi:hypothetical protein
VERFDKHLVKFFGKHEAKKQIVIMAPKKLNASKIENLEKHCEKIDLIHKILNCFLHLGYQASWFLINFLSSSMLGMTLGI